MRSTSASFPTPRAARGVIGEVYRTSERGTNLPRRGGLPLPTHGARVDLGRREGIMGTESRFCHVRGQRLLEAQGVTKTYRVGTETVYALRDVDFIALQGDFVVINGPSGSGKTTFLNLISVIDRPTSGEVFIEGEPTSAQSEGQLATLRKTKIGLVFQSFNLIPVLSAAENVEYPLLLQKRPPAERRARVSAMLAEVGLSDLAHRRPERAVRRSAPACGDRPRPRVRTDDRPCRRADGKPRLQDGRGGHGPHAQTQRRALRHVHRRNA